jgi:UDP-N-acetylglucosamine 2-epimerase
LANPYGDGRAGEKIAEVVAAYLCDDQERGGDRA